MKQLYCPWREKYITKSETNKCVFCNKIDSKEDEKNYILFRSKNVIVILNLYPYNAGHLLILPIKHVSDLTELSATERAQMMEALNNSIEILKKELKCDGINSGINLGKVSGAGIPGHFHIHVLPRWEGDTNFMPTLCDTKQISVDMNKIYKKLKSSFAKLTVKPK